MKLLNLLSELRKKGKVYISTESLLNETKLQLGNIFYLADQLDMSSDKARPTDMALQLNGVHLGATLDELTNTLGEADASMKKVLAGGTHRILFYQKELSGFRMNIRAHLWDDHFFMGESIYEELQNPFEFKLDEMVYEKYLELKNEENTFFNKIIDPNGDMMYITRSVGFRMLYLSADKEIKKAIKNEIQIAKSNKESRERIIEEKLFDQL